MTPSTSAHQRSATTVSSVAHGPRTVQLLDIMLGNAEMPVGVLRHFKDGPTECSEFTFDRRWLNSDRHFTLSQDLRRTTSGQWRRASGGRGSPVFAALADTQPDGFARLILDQALHDPVIRSHQMAGHDSSDLMSLCTVHDHCRLGALRIRPRHLGWTSSENPIDLPTHVDLAPMLEATAAFERGHADQRQLKLLLSSATSLGGSRPKICFVQEDKTLAVARFPSVFDEYPVTKAEVLGSMLAKAAGIHVAEVKLKQPVHLPMAIVQRFDRGEEGGRLAYLSARSLLLAEEGEEVSCMDLLNGMRACCTDFNADARQLWRRLMFKLLINNVDARLHKIGFLYSGRDRWQLAPAINLTPSVKSRPPSTTPQISELGPRCDVDTLLELAVAFGLSHAEALGALANFVNAIGRWRTVASQFAVSMKPAEMDLLEGAMNNQHFRQARAMVNTFRAKP
jgi:serine/threonine-protein kinase HipA